MRRAPVAVVDPANCNGCQRCFDDCPYAAVTMVPHPNARIGRQMAVVDEWTCAQRAAASASARARRQRRSQRRRARDRDRHAAAAARSVCAQPCSSDLAACAHRRRSPSSAAGAARAIERPPARGTRGDAPDLRRRAAAAVVHRYALCAAGRGRCRRRLPRLRVPPSARAGPRRLRRRARTAAARLGAARTIAIVHADAGDEAALRRHPLRAAPRRIAARSPAPNRRSCFMDGVACRAPRRWPSPAGAALWCVRARDRRVLALAAVSPPAADEALVKLSFTHSAKHVAECRQLSAEDSPSCRPTCALRPSASANGRRSSSRSTSTAGPRCATWPPSGLSRDGASAVYERSSSAPARTASRCA